MRHGTISSPSLTTVADIRNAISVSGALSYNSSTGVLSYAAPSVPTKTSQLTNDSGFLTGNQTITASGDVSGSGTTTLALTLASTAVTSGSYGTATSVATFTVDAKGRLTAASATAIAFPVTSVAGRTGAVTIASADVTDAASANTASVIVRRDGSGNFAAGTITAALTGNASSASTATKLTTARAIAASGDATGTVNFDGSADIALPLTLATVNTNTGTFNNVTVNGKGLVTAASTIAYLTGNQTITISGDASGSGSTAIALTLATTGVTAGTYRSLTVNAKGLVTAGSNPTTLTGYGITDAVANAGGTPSVGTGTLANRPTAATAGRLYVGTDTLALYTDTGTVWSLLDPAYTGDAAKPAGSSVITLATVNTNTGTFNNVTVNGKGLVTAASSVAYLTGNQTITLSGDVSGSGSTAITATLAATAVTAGSYGSSTSVATFTVDAKGRLTAASSAAIAFPVTSVAGRTGAVTIASADITDAASANTASVLVKRDASGNFAAGTITAALAGNATTATTATSAGKLTTARAIAVSGDAAGTVNFDGTADVAVPLTLATVNTNTGTFNNVTVNGKGLVTAASNVAYLTANQTITLSGDVTGSGTSAITATLAATAVTAASYGSTTSVATFTVDAKGRLTAASNAAIAFPVTSVAGRTGAVTIASADITDATDANTASKIVRRDANGNFAAGTITAALAGNASSASTAAKLTTAHNIAVSGDATGSASFDGTADATVALTLATSGATAGTYTNATITVDAKGRVTTAASGAVATAYTGTTNQITVTAGTIALAADAVLPGNAGVTLPVGTTLQRAASPVNGQSRYNSDLATVEFYQGGTWVPVLTNSNALRSYIYYAEQFDNPTSANWSINGLAPAAADATNDALTVRAFDDATEEGVGFKLAIPTGVTNMTLRMRYRAATAPTLLTQAAVMRLHRRAIAANTAITAWTITTLNNLSFPANALYQSVSQTLTLSSLGITTGTFVQFELTRQGAATADTLTGDVYLLELIVDFT